MERGPVWVTVDSGNVPIGLLSAEVVGDHFHLWELSVHRHSQRQGLDRALMEHAAQWTQDHGLAAIVLTTFRDVA